MVSGMRVIKLFNAKHIITNKFNTYVDELENSNKKTIFYGIVIHPLTRAFSYVISAFVAVIGGNFVLDNVMTLGAIVSVTQLVDSLTRPLMNMASQITTLTKAIAGAERIFGILDIEEEIDEGTIDIITKDGQDYWYDTSKTDINDGIITKVDASVVIKDLYFKYDKSNEQYILKNIWRTNSNCWSNRCR